MHLRVKDQQFPHLPLLLKEEKLPPRKIFIWSPRPGMAVLLLVGTSPQSEGSSRTG